MTTREQRDAIYNSPQFKCLQARAMTAKREMDAALKAINAEFPLYGFGWVLGESMVSLEPLPTKDDE